MPNNTAQSWVTAYAFEGNKLSLNVELYWFVVPYGPYGSALLGYYLHTCCG
uniref:Uncharacterized protein n=1 Tax=Arundo donax TaxID=35708 RepID=A0A0A9CD79_ARUDO